MKKTAQFGLNQWEMSDRIQMQDFNRDNAAIEGALAKRNCQFYTASYTGDGKGTKTWTFPAKPVFVVIIKQSLAATTNEYGSETVLIRDSSVGSTQMGSNTYQLTVTWEEKSVTVTDGSRTPAKFANESNKSYGLFAILEAE